MSAPAPAPIYPPGRYGRRREPGARRPWLRVLAVGIALALGGAIAWRLYGAYGTPPLQTQVVSYQVISDARVEITFRVTAADDHSGGELRCTLRARGSSGDEVARAEVTLTVPPGETLEARRTLTTRARAVTGELLRCA